MREIRSAGYVLSTRPYREYDSIVELLTPDMGKLPTMAYSARRSRKRFGGALDLFTLLTFRASDRGEDRPARLEEAEPRELFFELRESLECMAAASHAVESISTMVRQRDPAPDVFELLSRYLPYLADHGPSLEAVCRFQMNLLNCTGFQPELEHCGSCSAELTPDVTEPIQLDPGKSCLRCSDCAAEDGLPISAEAFACLREIRRRRKASMAGLVEAGSLLDRIVEAVSGRQLKSRSFLRDSAGI